MKHNIAIFVSASGTNCENIIRYFADKPDVNIRLVVSNRADAFALVRAKRLGVPTAITPKAAFNNPDVLMPLLREHGIDFIVLAGFLLMVPDYLLEAFPRRIVNIHPPLLSKYGGRGMHGQQVHEAVKAAGETETGITIHYVSEVCDGGEIIEQYRTTLSADDTPDDIAEKVHILEQKYFPGVIERVLLCTEQK